MIQKIPYEMQDEDFFLEIMEDEERQERERRIFLQQSEVIAA